MTAVLCALLLGQGHTLQMKVEMAGNPASIVASVHQRPVPDGGKFLEMRLDMKRDKVSTTVRRQSTFDAKMRCVRIVQEVVDAKGERNSTVVTLSESGAQVVHMGRSPRKSIFVPVAKGAPLAAKSEFWFWKLHPKIGEQCAYYAFDSEASEWKLTQATYEGDVDLAGVKCHKVSIQQGDRTTLSWMDDEGMPVRIESEGAVFRRA